MTWEIATIGLGALAVVHVVLLVAVILQLRAWGRESDEWAARRERGHQETMVDMAISRRCDEEAHARRMRDLATPGR